MRLDEIATSSYNDRRDLFNKVAFELGISNPLIIEKDFWVSWTLQKLFSKSKDSPKMIFKGGTSLSKGYDIINRFSEDIDITMDRSDLGFNEPDENILKLGSTRRNKYFDELRKETTSTINNKIIPQLNNLFSNTLVDGHALRLDEYNQERIFFDYPNCFKGDKNQYLSSTIILEFGSRGDIVPTEEIDICSYIGKALPEHEVENPKIPTLRPTRTFWEKILILRNIALQNDNKPIRDRLSRHYYDVSKLSKHKVFQEAMKEPQLLLDAAKHNHAYFRSTTTSWETINTETLNLIPSERKIKQLCYDYEKMTEMFTEPAPTFSKIIEDLHGIQKIFSKDL